MIRKSILLLVILLLSIPVMAQHLKSEQSETTHTAEMRVSAAYKHSFRYGISLSIEEEIRTCLGGSMAVYPIVNDGTLTTINSPVDAAFTRANTTLTLAYAPIKYLNIAVGYRLKIYGNHGWTDPNEYIRHRGFIHLSGQMKLGRWKLSLRERLVMDCRTDSVNKHEKSPYELTLRTRAQVGYTMFNLPIKYHLNVELINTLNQPTKYLNAYAITPSHTEYKQYISSIRPEIGISWHIDKHNTLSLYYRYTYDYNRDINITRNKQYVELTHTYDHQHIIGIAYEFD